MSVQSSSTQNGYIWENKELNLDITSICFINKKFVNESATFQLSECIAEIESKSRCVIIIHGQKSEVIWFCIKHESAEQRQVAFDLINKAFNHKLNEVKLPKLIMEEPKEDTKSFRLSTPSPPLPSILNQPATQTTTSSFSNTTNDSSKISKTNLTSVQIAATNYSSRKDASNTAATNQTVKKSAVKSSMTRSSTESFITSLTYSKSSFGASNNLRDEFTNRLNQQQQHQQNQKQANLDKKLDKLKIDNHNHNKYKLKNRYTVDFLLQRADTINSKKPPHNWKELSEKYPTVCFSGKVISYFDPYKYYEHWEKTKKQNSELHSEPSSVKYTPSLNTTTNKKHANGNAFGYHYTDDFLNMNSFSSRDMNNNNYYNFKPNRMTMIHPNETSKLKRFESLHYNVANHAGNEVYFMKNKQQQHQQQQQHDLRNGFDGLQTRNKMSKTHSYYNFNN